MTEVPFDLNGLETMFNRIQSHKLAVTITPQMDDTRPWLVEVELPVLEGREYFYFTDTTLQGALKKALDEYAQRDAAREVLRCRPARGIRKADDRA